MRRIAIWFAILSVLHAAVIVVTVALGRAQPLSVRAAQFNLHECAPPCWIGIIPGKTSFEGALSHIKAVYGTTPDNRIYVEATWVNIINSSLDMSLNISFDVDDNHIVQTTRIWQYMGKDITFSELYSLLYTPHYLTTLPDYSYYVTALMNDDYTVGVILEQDRQGRVKSELPVNRVIMTNLQQNERYKLYTPLPWRGFRLYRRY
jgi:hypothetical protein